MDSCRDASLAGVISHHGGYTGELHSQNHHNTETLIFSTLVTGNSMTYTIAQRDALRQAIVSGVLRLSYDGKNVEYRSMAELKAALNEVEASLARDSGQPHTRQIKIYADKDL